MAKLTRTWWGQRFIEALEKFTDRGRLDRGRSYRGSRIQGFAINNGKVSAKVEGKINPYFGVYEVPIYKTGIRMTPIPETRWHEIIRFIGAKAGMISALLMNQVPDDIEDAFEQSSQHLLPRGERDFKTNCSCPDYANPCKHVAGLCYRLAGELDRDPFLLFELRGLPREQLHLELAKTPLGKTLARALAPEEQPVQPVESYYTRAARAEAGAVGYDDFWHGAKRLPAALEPLPPAGLPALIVRKAGDYPAFWDKDQSFIEAMSEFYERVRKTNKDLLS